MPIAAILALTELIAQSNAGTMFELVGALKDGAEVLKKRSPNPISLSAGCELLVAFVTIFPHESDVRLRLNVGPAWVTHQVTELRGLETRTRSTRTAICQGGSQLSRQDRQTDTGLHPR
jgi:translation initiation factor 2B subunit (eIF-2B alpha/beta/delta family)